MTEFQAAILLAQLSRFPRQLRIRARNAAYLNRELARLPAIGLVRDDDPRVTRRSYHLYVFRYLGEEQGGWPREKFIAALRAEGIPVSPGYPKPLYGYGAFRKESLADRCPFACPAHRPRVNYDTVRCPEAERLCRQAVWLGQSVLLGSRRDMQDIVRAIHKVLAAMR